MSYSLKGTTIGVGLTAGAAGLSLLGISGSASERAERIDQLTDCAETFDETCVMVMESEGLEPEVSYDGTSVIYAYSREQIDERVDEIANEDDHPLAKVVVISIGGLVLTATAQSPLMQKALNNEDFRNGLIRPRPR